MSAGNVHNNRKAEAGPHKKGIALRGAVNVLAGILLGTAMSSAFAGGADVSEDELYSDDITVTTWDDQPLDMDGDGNVDLAVAANRDGPAGRSRFYLGNGDGTFGNDVRLGDDDLGTDGPSSEIIAADFNGDGDLDLLLGRRDQTMLIFSGDGAGNVDDGTEVSADTDRVLALAVGDLDNDGDLDIVAGTGHAGGGGALQTNKVCLKDPDPALTFTCTDISADQDDTRSIALADIDGDGLLDVIAGNDETTAGGSLVVYLNDGGSPGTFLAAQRFGPETDQISKLLIGDLDGDGDPDIVTVNNVGTGASEGLNRYFLNESTVGNLAFTVHDVSADINRSHGGAIADFDGDGDLDIAVANTLPEAGESGRNRLYLNQFVESGNTAVSFVGSDISPDEHMSRELAAGDLNNDGAIDIVVGNQDNVAGVRDRRYLNNGTADPFANIVPEIDAYNGTLETDEQTDLTIVLDDFDVIDGDNVFPGDFTLTVQDGDNYSVTDNTITPDPNFDGELTVPVIVNDGTDDSDPFELTVTVNDTLNTAPAFTSTAVTDATEDTAYAYAITAEDPDISDVLTITEGAALPAWLTLTDNGDGTATLEGTPAEADVGDHAISLMVSDGADSAAQDFTITVAAAGSGNTPPAFTSTAVQAAMEGQPYTYDVTAEDADGDPLAFAAPALPGWLQLTDHGDGSATLEGTPDGADVGEHDITIAVSDGTDTAAQDFTITVAAAGSGNTQPAFTSTPVTDATEDEAYTYEVTAEDADGDPVELTAPTLPDWLSFDDNGDGTGTLSGTPGDADVGEHTVALRVFDGTDGVLQEFTVTVEAAAAPPPPPPPPPSGGGGGGGGGALDLASLLALLLGGAIVGTRRRPLA